MERRGRRPTPHVVSPVCRWAGLVSGCCDGGHPVSARQWRAATGHSGRAEQEGGRRAGPVAAGVIGHATGTTAADSIVSARTGHTNMVAGLDFRW